MPPLHGPESSKVLIPSSDLTESLGMSCMIAWHHSLNSTARNFRFTDVLDVVLIIGSRSASLLDIAAPVEKQIKNVQFMGAETSGH